MDAKGAEQKPFPNVLIGVPQTPAPVPDELWTTWSYTEPMAQRKWRPPAKRHPGAPPNVV